MSQENVEAWRVSIEAIRGRSSSDFDLETTLDDMATPWEPAIEWDISGVDSMPDIDGVYRGIDSARQFSREWLAAWEPSTSSTNWLTPVTA